MQGSKLNLNLNEVNSMNSINEPLNKLPPLQTDKKLLPGTLVFENFNGYWREEFTTPSLKKINYRFKTGNLYGIAGKVGSGKSGLLGAILHEVPFYSGKLDIKGSVAYVEQEPIVFSDTIRNNILFGRPFNEEQY
jgi:ABC-type multidrug transport system fused ATPase/permease subunit